MQLCKVSFLLLVIYINGSLCAPGVSQEVELQNYVEEEGEYFDLIADESSLQVIDGGSVVDLVATNGKDAEGQPPQRTKRSPAPRVRCVIYPCRTVNGRRVCPKMRCWHY